MSHPKLIRATCQAPAARDDQCRFQVGRVFDPDGAIDIRPHPLEDHFAVLPDLQRALVTGRPFRMHHPRDPATADDGGIELLVRRGRLGLRRAVALADEPAVESALGEVVAEDHQPGKIEDILCLEGARRKSRRGGRLDSGSCREQADKSPPSLCQDYEQQASSNERRFQEPPTKSKFLALISLPSSSVRTIEWENGDLRPGPGPCNAGELHRQERENTRFTRSELQDFTFKMQA